MTWGDTKQEARKLWLAPKVTQGEHRLNYVIYALMKFKQVSYIIIHPLLSCHKYGGNTIFFYQAVKLAIIT